MRDCLLTIITPVYNSKKALEKTHLSIQSQIYKPKHSAAFEWLVVDGLSNDGVGDLVNGWIEKFKYINFISQKDNGIYDAMNIGVEKANGKFVIFFGAGDVFADNHVLETLLDAIANKAFDILYGWSYMDDGKTLTKYIRKIDWSYSFRADPISHQAVLASKDLLKQYPFDLNFKVAADQDWIMHMHKLNKRFYFVDKAICKYDIGGYSGTDEGKKISTQEIRLIHKKYYPVMFSIHQALRLINKKIFHYQRL